MAQRPRYADVTGGQLILAQEPVGSSPVHVDRREARIDAYRLGETGNCLRVFREVEVDRTQISPGVLVFWIEDGRFQEISLSLRVFFESCVTSASVDICRSVFWIERY